MVSKNRKTLLILRKVIVAEMAAYLVFMALALSADWGQLYEGTFLYKYVRFEILEFSLLGLLQIGLIIIVFLISMREEKDIRELMKAGEHEKLEFKSSLRWDLRRQQINRDLEKTVMKSITAFMNSDGGNILLGVNDDGKALGLKADFESLNKPNIDGFENHFNNIFRATIGPEYRQFVKLNFSIVDSKTICQIDIEPSHKPVYLKDGGSEDFYIRTGNVTTPLKMSEAATYISTWRK